MCILTHKKYGWLKQAIFRLGFFFYPQVLLLTDLAVNWMLSLNLTCVNCFNVTRYRFNEITFIRENLSYQFG